MSITPEKLAELKALLAKATPVKWRLHDQGDEGSQIVADWPVGRVAWVADTGPLAFDHDAPLIVAAVNALPDLLATIEKLEKVCGAAEARRARHSSYEVLDELPSQMKFNSPPVIARLHEHLGKWVQVDDLYKNLNAANVNVRKLAKTHHLELAQRQNKLYARIMSS